MSKEVNLTSKQLIFAQEYLAHGNSTRAAVSAGYSEKTAGSQGSRLLKNVNVKSYIDKKTMDRVKELDISADKILQEIANTAFFNIRDIYENNSLKEIDSIDINNASAISSVKVRRERREDNSFDEIIEIKTNDKLRALDMLAKNLGLYETDNEQRKDDTNINVKRVTIARRSDRT